MGFHYARDVRNQKNYGTALGGGRPDGKPRPRPQATKKPPGCRNRWFSTVTPIGALPYFLSVPFVVPPGRAIEPRMSVSAWMFCNL